MINSRYPTLVMQFTHTKAFHRNDEPKPEPASVYPNLAGRETAKVVLLKLGSLLIACIYGGIINFWQYF